MTPSPKAKQIQDAIRKRYADVARTAKGKFAYPTGKEGAEALGYDRAALADAPKNLLESFCGVGNPFALGTLGLGEAILDVGYGAGFDLFVAGRMVGPAGRLCGIDLTPEMAECAQRNLGGTSALRAEVRVAAAEAIPYLNDSFDVVLSNGVLNLSPRKDQAFLEILRVLRPGGRLQLADIVLKADLPEELAASAEAWSD